MAGLRPVASPPCVAVVATDELNYNPAKRQCVLIISRLLLLPGRAYTSSYTRGQPGCWLYIGRHAKPTQLRDGRRK